MPPCYPDHCGLHLDLQYPKLMPVEHGSSQINRPSTLQHARMVDLGGGTGNFTQALAEAAGCRSRVLCVDAFAEMLQKASPLLAVPCCTCLGGCAVLCMSCVCSRAAQRGLADDTEACLRRATRCAVVLCPQAIHPP